MASFDLAISAKLVDDAGCTIKCEMSFEGVPDVKQGLA
jgi:hypothetical protein